MSMPQFPKLDSPIKPEDALSMILVSIAMEELGLSCAHKKPHKLKNR